MSDAPSGPWGSRDGSVPVAPRAHVASPVAATAAVDHNPPQNRLWAVASTALLAGLLWWLMGWVYALAGVIGLLVHEYGHVLAMNRLGMGPARIYVIPFLGGAARGARAASTEWHGVLVSLAGPAFGMVSALPFFGLWAVTGDDIWLQGAWFIALINLLNLAPAPPLDGSKALGPVLARVHPMLEKVALIGVGVLVIAWGVQRGSYILAVFLALSIFAHLRAGAWRPDARPLTPSEAGRSLALYLGVALLCAGGALAALLPLAGGDLTRALAFSGQFFGTGR